MTMNVQPFEHIVDAIGWAEKNAQAPVGVLVMRHTGSQTGTVVGAVIDTTHMNWYWHGPVN